MLNRRLRRIVRPLTRTIRWLSQRWDAVSVRRNATRLLRSSGDWDIGRIRRARSGTRIARIRSVTAGTHAVLKITDASDGARGLERERTTLSRLAAEPRLDILRALLPEVIDAGSDGRWSYLLQRDLQGEPSTMQFEHQRERILSEGSDFAQRLHASTAAARVVSPAEIEEWVERPIDTIRELVAPPGSREATSLDRLGDELREAIGGATMLLGWIHGDLWSDNILVSPRGGGITGIVDWDSASDAGLGTHDQLHLVLYARKVLAKSEVGVEICRALGPEPGWDAVELAAVFAATDTLPGQDEASRRRLGILLYWLRLVMMNRARQPATARSRRWLDDNVRAVLACL